MRKELLEYQEQQIIYYLREMERCFDKIYDIDYLYPNLVNKMSENEKAHYEQEKSENEGRFLELSKYINITCLAYFETHGLNFYITNFQEHLKNYCTDAKILSPKVTEDGLYSDFAYSIWRFLAPFPAFASARRLKYGINYLENILKSTSVILTDLNFIPSSETEVSSKVKQVIKYVFTDYISSNTSFQKIAKCYIPDILIPSLRCAIEYKFARNIKKITDTVDEILIDVEGYKGNRDYDVFYVVFYCKTGICTESRLLEIWEEKQFSPNWKPVYVEGNVK